MTRYRREKKKDKKLRKQKIIRTLPFVEAVEKYVYLRVAILNKKEEQLWYKSM